MKQKFLDALRPMVIPELDPAFRPAALSQRALESCLESSSSLETVHLALVRPDQSVYRFKITLLPDVPEHVELNTFLLERQIKFLLWSRGAATIQSDASPALCQRLHQYYVENPLGQFDAAMMGEKIFESPFKVHSVATSELPEAKSESSPLGGHLSGCRIGFDLGGSDQKIAAMIDGEAIFSEEIVWDPIPQQDPQWHYDHIMSLLQRAASKLPQVDAIGGSAAGVYVQNQVKVASLFRGIPEDLFQSRVKGLFMEMKRAWRNIPFEVVNDGEVTALAGSMNLGHPAVLGIAMGTNQAAGFVTPEGQITSWLNELAFAPIDYRDGAPRDEWSGDVGCGVQFFSQQAVARLIPASGLEIDRSLPFPEQLVAVQTFMAKGDDRAAAIYRTMGVYLGYALAQYKDYYPFEHLLLLGRVTTGTGADQMIEKAKEVLHQEFPIKAASIAFHLPGEKEKRHGQAMAAASLPAL